MIMKLAEEDEIKQVLKLVKNVENDDIKNMKGWMNAIEYFAKTANNKTYMYLLIESEQIIGFVYFLHKIKKNVIKLYGIAKFTNNKGVGVIMMDWLMNHAKGLKCEYVEFDSDERFSGYNFFKNKMGYIPLHKKDDTHWYFRIMLNKTFW
jgi:predicted acetyltransferase